MGGGGTSNASPGEGWPDFFPAGVPPAAASNASGRAFRLVRTIPSQEIDFLPSCVEYPSRWTSDSPHYPQACGASFHTSLEASRRTRLRFRPLRGRLIAEGILVEAHGKMLTTGNDPHHITVWVRVDSEIHLAFAANAELEQKR